MRKIAESELADRRKDVAAQQAQATKLELAATSAKDAAQREETRRTQLAQQRARGGAGARADQGPARRGGEDAHRRDPGRDACAAARRQARRDEARVKANAKITDIGFRGTDQTGDVTIALAGDANVELGEVTATTVELIVDSRGARRQARAQARRQQARHAAAHDLVVPRSPQPGSRAPDRRARHARHADDRSRHQRDPLALRRRAAGREAPAAAVGGFGAASTPVAQQSVSQVTPGKRHIYHGQTVSFDIKDAPTPRPARLIAETVTSTSVVPDNIDAKVTVKLNRVPWDQALEVILRIARPVVPPRGNLYRVATRKEIDTEDKEAAERRAAMIAAESPRTRSCAQLRARREMKTKFEGMLSPRVTSRSTTARTR